MYRKEPILNSPPPLFWLRLTTFPKSNKTFHPPQTRGEVSVLPLSRRGTLDESGPGSHEEGRGPERGHGSTGPRPS